MSTTTAPARTEEQRLEALREANAIRTARAELKRRLKTNPRLLIPALELDTERLGLRAHDLDTMQVVELIRATPKIGRVKANRVLMAHRISPSRTLAGLTDRQRNELLDALRPAAAREPFRRFNAEALSR